MIGQEKNIIRNILTHLAVVCCFLLITFIYLNPEFQGKTLMQTDVHQYLGMSQELRQYYEKEGVSSAWTGSMFSGMPSYQIGVWGPSPNLFGYIEMPLRALGNTAGPVFAGMLMAYIMFLALGFRIVPAALGAVAYSLSSYNIIILEAGHVTKAWAIAYMPLIVAGMLVMFRKKYILGGLLMAIGLSLQIKSNHLQITYYTGLFCAIIFSGFLYQTIKQKDFKGLSKATGILAIAVVLGVLSNLSNFYSNYEMAQESIRGKSELSQPTESEKQSSGLDIEYAFRWSYGKSETFTFLIPDLYGGVSKPLDKDSETYKTLIGRYQSGSLSENEANGLFQMMTPYWGDQPFTSGPVYFGAIVCFLFILGMIIIRSKMKWLFLAATIFFIFLSWGRHFGLFNDFLFYHFPMYNKFRAVSMSLVIPALTMLIVAIWGLKEFLESKTDKKKLQSALYWSAGVTGGICFILWLMPGAFLSFLRESDEALPAAYNWFTEALANDRKELLTADALRSFLFILLAAATLWFATKMKNDKPINTIIVSLIIGVLIIGDLWSVDKRYLNDSSFVKKEPIVKLFPQSKADNFILQDKSPSYRVLNLTNPANPASAFNEANTAFHHKSVGGYHAAKLKRYQELIEYHLVPELTQITSSFRTQNIDSVLASFGNVPALNMLNTKYVIIHPDQPPLENPYRYGNAWFVSGYTLVNNADEEIGALNSINPAVSAIVDKKFESELAGLNISPDSTATIEMTSYKPDRVKYRSNSKTEQLAVFSEVYYPHGWEAFIDGKPVSHFRTDWILRAMRIPAGEHEIEFKFIPHTYLTTRTVSNVCSGLLILLLLGTVLYPLASKKLKKDK